MKAKNTLCGFSIAVVLQLGLLAGSAQTNIYLFSGSETNITLPPGTYIITAYGAPGGGGYYGGGGGGAKMSAEFNFSMSTNLTLLVGGGGGNDTGVSVGGGGGSSFVVEGTTPLVIAGGGGGGYSGGGGAGDENGNSDLGGGGGGGSIIDSSAIAILTEVSNRRIVSPDDPYNGEIIITALPPPLAITTDGVNAILLAGRRHRFHHQRLHAGMCHQSGAAGGLANQFDGPGRHWRAECRDQSHHRLATVFPALQPVMAAVVVPFPRKPNIITPIWW